ncbi:MAG: ketol-acid reductoisomerase [Terriglobia bacterium]|jgi:ketol-acid reductoisomerase
MEPYYDPDASLEILRTKTLGVIGYGNQGRAQALNLRDSGLDVIVGSLRDETASQAEKDGFVVRSVAEVAERADVLALLIPDEVQREVYHDVLSSRLRGGQTLDFAHGYNIHFGLIAPPPDVDVIMVAPRMIGTEVRESFVDGRGAPAFIAVAQDASGHALETALAWARGIGATRAGAFKTTFAQETDLDLFQEQAVWPLLFRTWTTAFECLVEHGFPPEMVALEMYGSGEAAEIFREMARVGFFKQARFHSQTSQYGTLSRASSVPFAKDIGDFMEKALGAIRDGRFDVEWRSEQAAGYPVFKKLRAQADSHPINQAEAEMRRLLRVKSE